MSFIETYFQEEVASLIVVLLTLLLRLVVSKTIKRYAKSSQILEHRTNLVIKYTSIFISVLFVLALSIIWGVQTTDVIVTISSVITVIGVALFAQWSILSNITSGIILLFSFPFKIGDNIQIHDKDFPIEAEILDIRAFHTLLISSEGVEISYPNNLLMQKGVSIMKHPREEAKEFVD